MELLQSFTLKFLKWGISHQPLIRKHSYSQIMRQCDTNFDLKINIGQHGLVILLIISKIIWWMNIIVDMLDQCDTKIDLINICRSVIYILWSSDFASYLEDYLMEKCCTLDNGSV